MAAEPVQLGDEQSRKARELAERTGASAEDVANRALDEYYAGHGANGDHASAVPGETVYEALLRSGSLGCFTGGPADLTTNPDHMQGFGESSRE